MAELLSKFKALGASEEEANGVMELIDSHHTGDISFDEFASAIGPLMASRKSSALKRAFDRFDTDGSGKIDRNELRSMLVKLGWNADDTKVDEMMRYQCIMKMADMVREEFSHSSMHAHG